MVKIAVLGYGTIGSGVAEVVEKKQRGSYEEGRGGDFHQIYPGSS